MTLKKQCGTASVKSSATSAITKVVYEHCMNRKQKPGYRAHLKHMSKEALSLDNHWLSVWANRIYAWAKPFSLWAKRFLGETRYGRNPRIPGQMTLERTTNWSTCFWWKSGATKTHFNKSLNLQESIIIITTHISATIL